MERVREGEHNKQSYIPFCFVHWIPHTPTKVSLTHCIYCDRWWCRGLLLLLFATFAAWVNVAVPILVVSKIKDKDFEQKWQQHRKIASSILLVQKNTISFTEKVSFTQKNIHTKAQSSSFKAKKHPTTTSKKKLWKKYLNNANRERERAKKVTLFVL